MKSAEPNILEDFFFNIASVPGSSDEVCQKAIKHYEAIKSTPDLDSRLIVICDSIIGALTEYYKLANLNSENLRGVLPHLSEIARFMEAQTTIDMDVESSGRIKSFYSVYVKIIDKIKDRIEKNKPIPSSGFLGDTWATRDILHPRHDMKYNTQAFYKTTYSVILEFMEYIDKLSQEDSRYSLKEYSEETLLNLQRPKKYSFSNNVTIALPEHDFLDYAFAKKNLQEGFKYIPELPKGTSNDELKSLLQTIKSASTNDVRTNGHPLIVSIINQSKFEQLVTYRNEFEAKLLEDIDDKKVLSYYENLSFEEFFLKYKQIFSAPQRDRLRFLNFLNKKIQTKDSTSLGIALTEFESPTSEEYLNSELLKLSNEQNEMINRRISALKEININGNFEANYQEAQKLKKFSRCAKDYMRNPKKSGYQSFHVVVNTPYGPYEKQIRTESQDDFAERGPASHTNSYKPDVKSTFHRLKVTTPFGPKRDENGDIIIPIELGIYPFELAVFNYYKQPFSNFSGGKTLAQFKAEHPTKDDFDKALLALSPSKVSQTISQKFSNWKNSIKNWFSQEEKTSAPKIVEPFLTLTSSIYSDVPADISIYPNIPDTENTSATSPSTDDSDPHDNR